MLTKRKPALKDGWQVLSARVPPDIRTIIEQKYPNRGDISKLILALLRKVAEGRIIGLKLE